MTAEHLLILFVLWAILRIALPRLRRSHARRGPRLGPLSALALLVNPSEQSIF